MGVLFAAKVAGLGVWLVAAWAVGAWVRAHGDRTRTVKPKHGCGVCVGGA